MRRSTRLLLATYAGIAAFSLTTGCSENADSTAPKPTIPPTNVRVYAVRPDTLTVLSRLPATVQAMRHAVLSFQEPGTVAWVEADLGDVVEKGAALARLDRDLLEAAWVEAEAGLKFQRYNYDRALQLHGEGTISEQAFYAAEYDWKRATSNAQIVRERLENSVLRATFAGTVAARRVETGDLVQPGVPAFEVVQTDTVKMAVWVPETEIVDYEPGRVVRTQLDALAGRVFTGNVSRVGPAGDPTRRVFPMEVLLPNPGGDVRVGMMGRLEAERRTYRDVVVIPREAVQQRQEGPIAFVFNGNAAEIRQLVLGPSEGNRVVVEKGIGVGDRVIVSGGRDLIDGESVAAQGAGR